MPALPEDPTARQLLASDPNASVWVTASAGSGKTQVLTDRVLRLLLAGTPPSKILCITYTKAGAAEMRGRIDKRLGEWVMMEEDKLVMRLTELTGATPNDETLRLARRLFATVIEDPVGLRIQTIHAFCQSLLARFPIEAGVPPNFTLLEGEKAAGLLAEAKAMLSGGERMEEDTPLNRAILKFARTGGEWKFDELLTSLTAGRKDMHIPVHTDTIEEDVKRAEPVIFAMHGLPENIKDEESLRQACGFSSAEMDILRNLCQWFVEGNDTVIKRGKAIELFLACKEPTLRDIGALADVFLTQKERAIPKKQFSEPLRNRYPDILPFFEQIGARCQEIVRLTNIFELAERSYAVYVIAAYLHAMYVTLKRRHAALDYDDLIVKARALISGDRALPWVMFKLDGGIEHVLIDEAQDTSQAQWDITKALVSEFFSGAAARESVRTLFVVGDPKQSIFRFQGAFPEGFEENRNYFSVLSEDARVSFRRVPLTTSFRSSPAILSLVDAVFASPGAREGLGEDYEAHTAFYSSLPGQVELWPLMAGDERTKKTGWEIPTVATATQSGARKLAQAIAATIQVWLKEGRVLPATGEPVRPQDIMILARRREPMATALIQSFRDLEIPCTGLDRLQLTEHIAIQDMLALGRFLLLPGDDLSLAAALKSPLYNISEDMLMELAVGREISSLWQSMLGYTGADPALLHARKELQELLSKTDFVSPYTLFAEVLYARDGMRSMAARLGAHVTDVLEIFLAEALAYEEAGPPSLEEFCHLLAMSQKEWKSEQEQVANEVRILTVHGAKGLEAPIVFLVDTTSEPTIRENDRLAYVKGIPVMLPSESEDTVLTAELRENIKREIAQEYRRLLYVALTRAKCELYVTGVQPAKAHLSESCWYELVAGGLNSLPHENTEGIKIFRVGGKETDKKEHHPDATALFQLPDFFHQPAEQETLRTIHNPSHIEEEADPVPGRSLKNAEWEKKREKGIFVHRLLEVLARVSPDARQVVAAGLAKHHGAGMDIGQKEELVSQVLCLMQRPDYAELFGGCAYAEVPISGVVDGEPISGQIDCLVIKEKAIHVIDFKTGAWDQEKNISKQYVNQMRTYAELLKQAYPDKQIHSFLLFTEGPELVPVTLPLDQAA